MESASSQKRHGVGTSSLHERGAAMRPPSRIVMACALAVFSTLAARPGTAREDGFEYDGQRYRSLSVIAEKITGAHWSGPRFFGVSRAAGRLGVPARGLG